VPKIAKERTEENQRRIEAAALELFTKQGFHGTNNRQIAEKVGVSTGTIYTYFRGKKAIFTALAHRYQMRMAERFMQAARALQEPFSKDGLKKLASTVESAMNEDPELFLLLLSDVIEFKNQHFRQAFHNVPREFQRQMGPVLKRVKQLPGWRGEDPAFALASAYTYFFTYFLMETHMQGAQHLGVSHDQATESFIDLLFHGMWHRPAVAGSGRAAVHGGTKLHPAEQDRIAYLRFLSGRLLNLPPDFPSGATQNGGNGQSARRPILFFPEIPRDRIDESQLQIEAAALELFTHQGFHGTNMRKIAAKAGVSQGAIYNYYPSKEDIFQSLVRSYRHSMRSFLERVFRVMEDPFSQGGLRLFAAAMRSMVYDDGEYWLLMYIDVVEFNSQHFLKVFRDIPEQFRRLLGPAVARVKKRPGWCGQDPALVMAMIYFYLHNYFVIERVWHGNRHLGVSDEEAVDRFIDIISHGLFNWPPCAPAATKRRTMKKT
jgi:AcrR family transcriptional regulator